MSWSHPRNFLSTDCGIKYKTIPLHTRTHPDAKRFSDDPVSWRINWLHPPLLRDSGNPSALIPPRYPIDNPCPSENNPPFSGKPSKPIISDTSRAKPWLAPCRLIRAYLLARDTWFFFSIPFVFFPPALCLVFPRFSAIYYDFYYETTMESSWVLPAGIVFSTCWLLLGLFVVCSGSGHFFPFCGRGVFQDRSLAELFFCCFRCRTFFICDSLSAIVLFAVIFFSPSLLCLGFLFRFSISFSVNGSAGEFDLVTRSITFGCNEL